MKIPGFKSDGCSMWPDGPNGGCCESHDKEYFHGGTAQDRLDADVKLMYCVSENSGPFMARLMFIGVCIGGLPFLPLPWRWGFGRNFWRSIWYDREQDDV